MKPANQAEELTGVVTDDTVGHDEIEAILRGRHHDPHAVLGVHEGPAGTIIRALRPLAWSVSVVLADGTRYRMRHVHEGVFSVTLPPSQRAAACAAITRSRCATGPMNPSLPPTTHTGTCPCWARSICT